MAKKKQKETEVIQFKEPENLPIEQELMQCFDEYAEEANIHRQFPHIVPGFKPIAGHALWSMWVNGRRSNKPYTKSAKVEGEIMGYSPHGGCLTADTKMFLLSGEIRTLGELVKAGKDEWVLSINGDGKIIPALATEFRKTKDVEELYEITFANGFSIKATGNHKFRLTTGEWVPAENLHSGHIIDYARFNNYNNKLKIYGFNTERTTIPELVEEHANKFESAKDCANQLTKNAKKMSFNPSKKSLNGANIRSFNKLAIMYEYNHDVLVNYSCSKVAEYIPYITSVKKIKCKTTPVYDFTVNGPENALISISEDNSLLACAHNSYGSLVRMAQDFVYHIPYIDGHGSFGSIVGGPTPGAARYTEMRLSKFAEDVLFYNTKLLDMGLNYLEEDEEPILNHWPALLPLLYITNTGRGMGFPIANQWSSGNLFEFKEQLISYLKTGKVDCSKIYPDFPTGGVIVNKSEMQSLYETGKGTIKLRGDATIEDDTIRITSLPYQKFPEDFLEDVKKYLSKGQHTIVDVANRCDKNGLLIEIDCEPGTAEYTLEMLYRTTSLQISISDEHKAVDENGKIKLYTFLDYMKSFVDSNLALVVKEAELNLENIEARLEIVNGLLSALDIIDEIIATIKKSKSMEDSKKAVLNMANRNFTERQADAIVHMPLGRLANLENVKLQEEKDSLEKDKAKNEDLRDNEKTQKKYFLNRFNKLVDEYGWERKTQLADIVATDAEKPKRIAKPTQLKPKKEFMIVLTSENCLKRIDVTKFRQTEEDEKNFKVQGNQKVTMISNKGQMYKVMSNQIDKCMPTASGTPINSIRPEVGDEKIIAIYSEDVNMPYIYFITKNGYGKLGEVKSTIKISKSIGTVVCGLKSEDDEVIAVKLLNENEKIEITTSTRTEVIESDKPQGRGSAGKRVITLKENENIIEVHSVQ